MLRGISKWRVASQRCCAATQNGELFPGDAAQHLKVASCFRRMLRSISKWQAASGDAARHLKVASCFPEMLRGNSKWRVASRRCCAASQSGELLPGDAARHLKVASCFPEMLHGISKWRVASRKCCAASQNGELLPENVAQYPRFSIVHFPFPRVVSSMGLASNAPVLPKKKIIVGKLLISPGECLISSGGS